MLALERHRARRERSAVRAGVERGETVTAQDRKSGAAAGIAHVGEEVEPPVPVRVEDPRTITAPPPPSQPARTIVLPKPVARGKAPAPPSAAGTGTAARPGAAGRRAGLIAAFELAAGGSHDGLRLPDFQEQRQEHRGGEIGEFPQERPVKDHAILAAFLTGDRCGI